MSQELGIIDILTLFGFDARRKTKLVRHQDARYDIGDLIDRGYFDLYQSFQSHPVFHDVEQVLSFQGDGPGRARFVGLYEVQGQEETALMPVPPQVPYQDWLQSKFHYKLERVHAFDDLAGRVVIDWGRGALAWHQHLTNKAIIELRPKGRFLPSFEDYLGFSLTYRELSRLVNADTAHLDWVAGLSAVAGVYLVLAETSGQQYVGSAYGLDGIWGRWRDYARTGDGGNVKLRNLMNADSRYPEAFRFSILQVLPKSTLRQAVLAWESRYKEKLGSRASGLNA